ncbi:MAG: segregation/condensation protein A [Candidatus Aminicenantes bacterium]|nr:segregation/condensation protein A [Candidatus Aminicenantes bacterium]
METADCYQVKLDVFEGPLDLLLFLIKKKKIDIHDIPIAVITREYLKYLDRKDQINLDREGEFLLIAALLIHIKSQMLLPREKDSREDEDDPRRILIDSLIEHQKIKAVSGLLKDKEEEESQRWKRSFTPPLSSPEEVELAEVSLFDLAQSFFTLMKRREQENIKLIKEKEYSLDEKMKEILDELKAKDFLDFFVYFEQQESLEEALLAFFSILVLIKNRIVVAIQEHLFHTIKVWLRKEALETKRP